jgi:hypothetical protein
MKDYIKPTFILAGLFPVAFAASCDVIITREDADALFEQWGDKGFAESEPCQEPVPSDFIQYCKFTSEGTEPGARALTS